MTAATTAAQVDAAFGDAPALRLRVQAALDTATDAELVPLLIEISSYVMQLRQENAARKQAIDELRAATEERPAKRRRGHSHDNLIVSSGGGSLSSISSGANAAGTGLAAAGQTNVMSPGSYYSGGASGDAVRTVPRVPSYPFDAESDKPEEPVVRFEDISFTLPVRKKMVVEIIAANSNGDGSIRAKPANGTFDDGLTLCWDEMEYVFSIPVPERAQPASHIVIIPRAKRAETIVFTVPATPPKGFSSIDPDVSIREHELFNALVKRVINVQLAHMGKRVVVPEEREFVSGLVQAHRKNEKHFYVKAYKGRQEGYLHFLPPGILWGFKKPIQFFPFSNIRAISYTGILSRTFNLVVAPNNPAPDTGSLDETVFEMLDQDDHQGIDEYVKRHRLNDASMAEERRAHRYNVNGGAATTTTDGDVQDAAPSELRRHLAAAQADDDDDRFDADEQGAGLNGHGSGPAPRAGPPMTEQEIQDAEDEQEEDFDPSGGSSDGSGTDSEEDDEDDEDVNGQEDDL